MHVPVKLWNCLIGVLDKEGGGRSVRALLNFGVRFQFRGSGSNLRFRSRIPVTSFGFGFQSQISICR